MTSKLDKADAQEWLESLQQVGEGWWRQVGLAVRAGAHKALKMERREFARAIGQRMIDPREAVVQLHQDGMTKAAIADILGLAERTVHNVLIEAGLIEGEPWVILPGTGGRFGHPSDLQNDDEVSDSDRETDDEVSAETLQKAINDLQAQIKGEKTKREKEVKDLKKKITEYQHDLVEAEREARRKAEEGLTEKERERARKEAEAWAADQKREVMAGLSHLLVARVVGDIENATEGVQELVSQDTVTPDATARIETAVAALATELAMAKLLVEERR